MEKIIRKGKILSGEYKDWEIAIQDVSESAGGFLILLFNGQEGYDDWVLNKEELENYFKIKEWVIEWDNNK
jgi:hypothetical protein